RPRRGKAGTENGLRWKKGYAILAAGVNTHAVRSNLGGAPEWEIAHQESPDTMTAAEEKNRRKEVDAHGSRQHEATARVRRSLRPSNPALEPEDEALHLHRAQRDLHHRPPENPAQTGRSVQLRSGCGSQRGYRPLRGDEKAGPGHRQGRGRAQ